MSVSSKIKKWKCKSGVAVYVKVKFLHPFICIIHNIQNCKIWIIKLKGELNQCKWNVNVYFHWWLRTLHARLPDCQLSSKDRFGSHYVLLVWQKTAPSVVPGQCIESSAGQVQVIFKHKDNSECFTYFYGGLMVECRLYNLFYVAVKESMIKPIFPT